MRRVLIILGLLALLILPGAPAGAVPRHLHILTTPNGKSHSIARGVTFEAPCVAFLNLHENVHEAVFGTTGTGTLKNPNGPLTTVSEPGTCTGD
jgi:hypothetical protein